MIVRFLIFVALGLFVSSEIFAQSTKKNSTKKKEKVEVETDLTGLESERFIMVEQDSVIEPVLPNAQWVDDQTIVLDVSALNNKLPDAYVVVFTLTQLATSADLAHQLMNSKLASFRAELAELGVRRDDLYTDLVRLTPIFEKEDKDKVYGRNGDELAVAFELKKNIHIRLKGDVGLDELMLRAARYELYNFAHVEYHIEDAEAIFKELRKKCVDYLIAEIEGFLELGVDLDTIYRIVSEEEKIVYPQERYFPSQTGHKHILKDEKEKAAHIATTNTSFYKPVSNEDFEIVLNPVVLRPSIQCMYNLKLKFVVNPKPKIQKETQQELIWLAPNGELQRLEIEK